jgi:hypothetical protein
LGSGGSVMRCVSSLLPLLLAGNGKVVAHDLQNSWRILAAAGIAGRYTATAAQAWLNHHRWKPGDADTYRFGPELDKMTGLIPSPRLGSGGSCVSRVESLRFRGSAGPVIWPWSSVKKSHVGSRQA